MSHAVTTNRPVRTSARGIRHVVLTSSRRTLPDSVHLVAATLVMAIALMLTSALSSAIREVGIAHTLDSLPVTELVVGPNDSLWSVATRCAVPGIDTRDLVRWLYDHNDLSTSALALGQRLRVPVTVDGGGPSA